MHSTDIAAFTDMLDAVSAMLSRGKYAPNATSTSMFFNAMRRYSLPIVRAAFDAHVADPVRGKFVPVPADLIAQIEGMLADDGRLGPEEAWALALRAGDEAETVVWTPEICKALEAARPVLVRGDEVGARMAFREAYTRLVGAARADMVPVQWQVTLGQDLERRQLVLQAAIADGRLPVATGLTGHVSELLLTHAPRGSVLLLTGGEDSGSDGDPPNRAAAVAGLQALRQQLTVREAGPSADALARAATEAAKARTAEIPLTSEEAEALMHERRVDPALLQAIHTRPNHARGAR